MDKLIRDNERLDDLERSGLKIIQNPKKFCFGMDAVLLSSFIKVKKNENILDLGTGTGIIPILLTAKTEGEFFTGLEIQEDIADMADRSIKYNGLENKVSIIHGDIKNISSIFRHGCMDVVSSNPPYMKDSHGLKNPEDTLAIARHEIKCNLEDVIKAADFVLKPMGRFYMVHRPNRLIDIIALLRKYKLEPKTMRFIHPFKDKAANMLLIEAIKGAGVWLDVKPALVIYEKPNTYSQELLDIYGY